MKTFLVRVKTPLGKRVINYIDWKYNGERSCCYIAVTSDGRIKVASRCHKKDHYPINLRNKYRRYSLQSEWVNQYQMNDL